MNLLVIVAAVCSSSDLVAPSCVMLSIDVSHGRVGCIIDVALTHFEGLLELQSICWVSHLAKATVLLAKERIARCFANMSIIRHPPSFVSKNASWLMLGFLGLLPPRMCSCVSNMFIFKARLGSGARHEYRAVPLYLLVWGDSRFPYGSSIVFPMLVRAIVRSRADRSYPLTDRDLSVIEMAVYLTRTVHNHCCRLDILQTLFDGWRRS